MGIKEKLLKKKQKMLEQIERGRKRSIQKEDERKRKRINKIANLKPGAKRAILEGLAMKKNPLQVGKEEYNRRRYERNKRFRDDGESKNHSKKNR